MMKTLLSLFFLFALIANVALAQNDIQSLQAEVNKIKAKPAKELTMEDVKFLENVVNMDSQQYGKSFQKVVDAQKRFAKSKLTEYDTWLKEKNKSQELELQLGNEQLKTKAQEDVIFAQNDTIQRQKLLIEKLQNDISQLKNQITRTKRANSKLKDEKTKLETVMQDNNEIVARVSTLLSDNIDLRKEAPEDIKSELENTECEVAEMLVQNYILTLDKLKNDKEYLDNLREYFNENKQYPDDFYDYLNKGQILLLKLQDSNIPCVNQKAPKVKASIDELKQLIENKECDFFCKIANFFSNNIWVVGLLVLIIIGIVLLFVVRKH